MIKRQAGFTLVEMMITMVVFVIAMVAASNIFSGLLTQFKQQSKVAETNIGTNVGLEMFRDDIERAGFGLPWVMNGAVYNNEAAAGVLHNGDGTALLYDPGSPNVNDAPNNQPRPVADWNNAGLNGSDVIVIKATSVGTDAASQKWMRISWSGASLSYPTILSITGNAGVDLKSQPTGNQGTGDYVIVLNPYDYTQPAAGRQRILINDGGIFNVQLSDQRFSFNTNGNVSPFEMSNYDTQSGFLVYGIKPYENPPVPPRMPFNRADYYVRRPATMPSRCAPNTGILYKATVSHKDGSLSELPILDCVVTMKTVFMIDDDNNPSTSDVPSTTLAGLTPAQIGPHESQLKSVRVYIVAQEGQKDTSYTYINPANPADPAKVVFDDPIINAVDLNAIMGPDYQYYRWKVYSIAVTPVNLR
jgi:prepilin-type N-terminal cleavage/methylation domain-containing protein